MKKFIIRLIVFLSVFSIVLISVGKFDNIGRCYNSNANIQKLTCFDSFDSLDILFLGNSYCYSGINTFCFDSVGLRTFNLGVSTGGPNFFRILLNDFIHSVPHKPKAVFILLSPMTLSSKSDGAVNNTIYRYLNNPVSNEEYIFQYDPSLVTSYPKLCACSFAKTFVNGYTYVRGKNNFCEDDKNEMLRTKGFIPSNEITDAKKELKTNHFFDPFAKENFNENKAQKMLALANYIEQQGMKAVFYEPPSNKLYSFFNKNYLNSYKIFMHQVKAKYPFFQINLALDQNKYRDQDHVNTAGSIIVCNELIKQIKEHKDLSKILPVHKSVCNTK